MNTPSSNSMNPFAKGCLVISLHSVWICLALIGVYFTYTSWRFVSNGVKVDSKVVDMDVNHDSDGTSYSPIFEYTYQGQTYQYNSINSSNPPAYQIGDHETLLVDPANPSKARADSFWELWLIPVIMLPLSVVLAVVMTVVSIMLTRFGRLSNSGRVRINTL